jgi:general secretion pathway protein J
VRTREHGFTLLELLVAMTLLAFLSLALIAGLRFGTNIWRKSEEKNIALNDQRTALRIIDANLGRLYPKFITLSPTQNYVDFDGAAGRMNFLSAAETDTGFLMRDTLEAVRSGGGLALRIGWTPDLARDGAGGKAQILLDRLSSVEFSYFGVAGDAKEPAWYASWHQQAAAPTLIRIHVVQSDPGAPPVPDMIMAPKIAADMSCFFDAASKFCMGRK